MELNLAEFPSEIHCKIFAYLPSSDLINLSLTCKSFNDSINGSRILCEKFNVTLSNKKKGLEWIGSRKYSNVTIDFCNNQEFFTYSPIFDVIGEFVSDLKISFCMMNTSMLKIILTKCTNLKQIKLHHNFLTIDAESDLPPLPNVENFEFKGQPWISQLFSHCPNVRKMSFKCSLTASGSEVALIRFLTRNCENLEELTLGCIDRDNLLLNSHHLGRIDGLKLKSLSLSYVEVPYQSETFIDFVKLSENTLESLELKEIDNVNSLIYFGNCKNLKTLTLTSKVPIYLNDYNFQPMKSVESLTIRNGKFKNIAVKFPNLKSLKVIDVKFQPREIKKLQKLENLTFEKCKISSKLNLRNLKELKLTACKFKGFKESSCRKNQLQRLEIKAVKNLKWLKKFLPQNYQKLNHLELIDVKINEKLEKIISKVEIQTIIMFSPPQGQVQKKTSKFEFLNCFTTNEDIGNGDQYLTFPFVYLGM